LFFKKGSNEGQNLTVNLQGFATHRVSKKRRLGTHSAPAEQLCHEAIFFQNSNFAKWQYLLNKTPTFLLTCLGFTLFFCWATKSKRGVWKSF
jgi:hypothetical protein